MDDVLRTTQTALISYVRHILTFYFVYFSFQYSRRKNMTSCFLVYYISLSEQYFSVFTADA
jgi:hypothetical protein